MPNELLNVEPPVAESIIVSSQQIEPPVAEISAAADAPAATFENTVGKDGALSDNWRNLLPENIRQEKCLDSIKNFSTLAQSYVHAQKSIGANKIAIPGADATPEEKETFFKALGRPDSAEKYDISLPPELPEGVAFNEESVDSFKKFAFERGWSNDEANAAAQFQAKMVAKEQQTIIAAQEAEFSQTETKLKQEYGVNFDSVIAQCNKAVQTFGVGADLKSVGLLNNYNIIKMFAKIGESLSESKLKASGETVSSNAKSRYDELYGNTESPYWKQEHPLHASAVAEVARLVGALAVK